jgi:signal transduction histidine kinase
MVLLVDDQPMVGEAVRRLLADEPSVQLHYCSDVDEALAQVDEIKPSVILQDLVMPKINGLSAVRMFRSRERTADTPIIVLSSREDPQTKSQAFAVGANDYLVKLPDKIELLARIKYHSRSYLNQVQRDEAYRALRESQQQLLDKNTALTSLNRTLEETARALIEAKSEADRANRAKSDFLSRMSHELRTPLHAILGFGQLLEMDELQSDQKDNVQQILGGGRHLLRLINEVLDITTIEAGRIQLSLEKVDVEEVLTECASFVRPLAKKRAIRLECDASAACAVHITTDRQRLTQVVLNLLSNAVKYNRDGGEISVSCKQLSPERLLIQVVDTGVGIPRAHFERLFGAFDRLGAEHSGVEGTGLGLAVTKRLVELLGGEIGVESVVGEGSTFTVALPLSEPASNGALSPTAQEGSRSLTAY